MNREIIFRGKRVDNREWEQGNGIVIIDKGYAAIPKTKDVTSEDYAITLVKVIPEMVGQYISIVDKKNNKIFNGDILRYTDSDGRSWNVFVKWRAQSCSFVFSWETTEGKRTVTRYADIKPNTFGDVVMISYVEIIGNIHDNPELLKS